MAEIDTHKLAAHAAALFCTDVIVKCFTAHKDEDLAEVVVSGLQRNQEMIAAWDLVQDLARESPGGSTFDTKFMSERMPDECLQLGEMFARAMVTSFGSEQSMRLQYKLAAIGHNHDVSTALTAHAPTLAQVFRPA